MRAKLTSILALALVAATFTPLPASAVSIAGCAPAAHAGGDWRGYGGDLGQTRNQPLESTLNPGRVASLAPAWSFDTTQVPSRGGAIQSTPIIAEGCMFVTTGGGSVFMLNADTGAVLWSRKLVGAGQTLAGEIISGSPVLDASEGVLYVGVSRPGSSYVAALDVHNAGAMLWTSIVDRSTPDSFIVSAPVLFNGMIFQGWAGYESQPTARGGYAILKAARACSADESGMRTCANPVVGGTGGTIIVKEFTISDAEYNDGYRGASIWCTAAVDPVESYAYACGGNPASKQLEHRYSNALLKIDLDPSRTATFGKIVDSYKGQTEQYYPGTDRQPACETLGDDVVYVAWSVTCLQLDLDFGSSPNLFRDRFGKLMVGDLQKSGVYHAIYADQMSAGWSAVVGPPCFPCNSSSGAVNGSSVFVAATPGPVMHSLTQAAGKLNWAMPMAPGGTHFQSVSTANGVVYSVNNAGVLHAYDAATGLPIFVSSVGQDAGSAQAAVSAGSSGVAIARNTVYAPSGTKLVAYR